MAYKLYFTSTIISTEVKVTSRHVQYMLCKTAHGHLLNLFDSDPMRQLLTPYLRNLGFSVPTKFDEIVNKLSITKVPLNFEYRVRKLDAMEFGEVIITPLEG